MIAWRSIWKKFQRNLNRMRFLIVSAQWFFSAYLLAHNFLHSLLLVKFPIYSPTIFVVFNLEYKDFLEILVMLSCSHCRLIVWRCWWWWWFPEATILTSAIWLLLFFCWLMTQRKKETSRHTEAQKCEIATIR